MLEAYKKGFDKVIWIDANCYAINNPQELFDILCEKNVICNKINSTNNYDAMSFQKTIRMLNQKTKTDIHNAKYIMSIVFGLNMECKIVKNFINDYYEMVKLGWPFLSIFPEEIVFTALFNKPEYKSAINQHQCEDLLYVFEKNMSEELARNNKYYFHHKDYSKFKKIYYVTFDNSGDRFANQLFCYVICKLFTIKFGHVYISRNEFTTNDFIVVNEENINDMLENNNLNKNIVFQGYFQKSDLFVNYQKQIIELIFTDNNNDYWCVDNKEYYVKDYLINSKHNINLTQDDMVLSIRLDNVIEYTCKNSYIISKNTKTKIDTH
jgi:hypothetical protein